MNIELANLLKEASEHSGNEREIREDYSGRGMSSRETCAVVVDSFEQLFSDVLVYFKDHVCDAKYEGRDIPNINSLRIDNMGRRIVLY